MGNLIFSTSATAQVTTDGTTNTTVNSDSNGIFTIEQGDRAGDNLFHSFGDFSVPTDGSAFFNNATDISNIFSRVTGGNISNIDGLIGANGSANLFLINPAGIMFGNNARLDIGGSFFGTTADSILFEDGEFSATNLDNPPLLTINAPIGLNFRNEPGDIVNTSVGQNPNGETNITGGAVGLQVSNGETLALVGGNVLLDDGNLSAKGGHIEIGSVLGVGEVGIVEADTEFNFNYDSINSLGDVTLQNTAVVDVTSNGEGSINVAANNLSINNSSLFAGITMNLNSFEFIAGDIVLNANNSVVLDNGDIANDVNFEAQGSSGNIEINTGSLTAINSSQITSQVDGTGNSGDININARGKVSFDGRDETDSFPSAIFTSIEPTGEGNGGNINIQAESLELTNRAQLLSNVEGIGDAGDINIEVKDEVKLVNSDLISEVTEPDENGEGGRGNGGDININTGSLLLQDGSSFLADTENIGNAGNINIEARESVVLEGEGFSAFSNSTNLVFSQISTTADLDTSGTSGNINISTNEISIDEGFISSSTFNSENSGKIIVSSNNLFLTNGGQIIASTGSSGNAGDINLNINDTVLVDGEDRNGFSSGLFASVTEGATGDGGSINIGSEQSPIGQLSLNNGATISVDTFGQGDAGSLSIFSNDIKLDGEGLLTGLFASVESGATGQGGDIFIDTDSLTLTNGGRVAANVESMGQGDAGTLKISASDSIVINGTTSDGAPSAITSVVNRDENGEGIGNGGDITVSTGSLSLIDGGRVSATSLGQGDGGDLTINASESIFISGLGERFRSGISVNALVNDGNSGNANITTNQLTIENGGTIEASNIDSLGEFPSGTGEPGNISIQANSIMLNNGGRIDAATQSESETGEGANINLQVNDTIRLENNSFISAQAFDTAKGGNLTVNTDFIIAFPNETPGNGNDIIASAVDGDGGNISISAESLLGIEERTAIAGNRTNDIDASSEFGLDGTISIFIPDINPVQGVTELPNNVVEPEQTVTQACANNRGTGAANSFVVKGRGGIPTLSNAPLSSEIITVDGESETSTTDNITTIATENGNITLARGAIKTADGQIILTPTETGSATRAANGSPNCG